VNTELVVAQVGALGTIEVWSQPHRRSGWTASPFAVRKLPVSISVMRCSCSRVVVHLTAPNNFWMPTKWMLQLNINPHCHGCDASSQALNNSAPPNGWQRNTQMFTCRLLQAVPLALDLIIAEQQYSGLAVEHLQQLLWRVMHYLLQQLRLGHQGACRQIHQQGCRANQLCTSRWRDL